MEKITYRKTLDVHKNGVQFILQGFDTADNMSRAIEISLMASGDTIDFPSERLVAMMYVTTPNATEPSINECIIKDNKIVYDVLPIVEEGITYMQLKIIGTSVDGATSVLATPKFAVEVSKSGTNDDEAIQSTTFTALESAIAKAKGVYDERLISIEVTDTYVFKVCYADGTVYESDALKECLLAKSYAVGETGIREEEATDNAKFYSGVSRSSSEEARLVGEEATALLEEMRKHGVYTSFMMDFERGELLYISPSYNFEVNKETGNLDSTEAIGTVSETSGADPTTGKRASAGRVLIVPRGEYNPNTTYEMLDLVNHNGHSWLAKKTVVGIIPSESYTEYWHKMFEIDTIVKNTLTDELVKDVGDLLQGRFEDLLSKAKYVTDLYIVYDVPTFVRWDASTENTPYKEGLTSCTDGFALVYGDTANHTINAWANGSAESYTHTVSEGVEKGWSKSIPSTGGTMTGPLRLGGGKGAVSADDNATYLEAIKDEGNYNRLMVTNPNNIGHKHEVKFVYADDGVDKTSYLLGDHNATESLVNKNFARIRHSSYVGNGLTSKSLTLPFPPKLLIVNSLIVVSGTSTVVAADGNYLAFTWDGNTVSWVSNTGDPANAYNTKDVTYSYVAIG